MGNCIDLSGQQFGQWVVLSRGQPRTNRHAYWLCQCSCGAIKEVAGMALRNGSSSGCGCKKGEKIAAKNTEDLSNQRFGKLVALHPLREIKSTNQGGIFWECICDCGNKKIVQSSRLKSGDTNSCGCINYSIGENNIALLLKQNDIIFYQEYSFSEIPKMRYDFYLPDYNRLIEFDGKQHYGIVDFFGGEEEFLRRQKNDNIKNEYAISHNIDLVRIPYWERDNITLNMILGDQYLYNPSDR